MARAAPGMPSGRSRDTPASLDGPLLRALVGPHRDLLDRLLRFLVAGARHGRLVQRGRRSRGRNLRGRGCGTCLLFSRARLGFALFGETALLLLLLRQLGCLPGGELVLTAFLLFPQLHLVRIDSRWLRLGRAQCRRIARLALDEDTLLADFDLNRARLPGRVRLLDLACLLTGERYLGLRFSRAMRAPQILEQPCLIVIAQRVFGDRLVDASRPQLLEQHRRHELQLTGKLCDACLCHELTPPRTSARAPA